MHSDTVVMKLMAIGSDLAKKNCSFLDYFFFLSILEAGASAVAVVGIHLIDKKKDCV